MEARMSESIEQAQQGLESAHDAASHEGDHAARWIAVLIAALAACLALAELGEKAAQNTYLTDHVTLSDDWAYYQAKSARATTREAEASVLESLPGAGDLAVQARIKQARDQAALLRDDPVEGKGMKQLDARAGEIQAERDHAFHHYHWYELAVGALQIAIVLASVSVVTRARALTLAAGLIGGGAAVFALSVALGLL
jgi:hypothetical protein